ncbi:MAG: hypothetical protein IJ223_01975 [Clostridia bacterium]|nr:hypothetical protein [Clostridia bacterium]
MKKLTSFILLLLVMFLLPNFSMASTDQYKAFLSTDFSSDFHSINATGLASATFMKLGYTNASSSDYEVAYSKWNVLNYISGMGNNYGIVINAHGNSTNIGIANQLISPSDIVGVWHLVALDCCECLQTNSFATAFKTVGYSNRATLGWYTTIWNNASPEWWANFYGYAGTECLRDAALDAANNCVNSTPIRIYGDKLNWDGTAW